MKTMKYLDKSRIIFLLVIINSMFTFNTIFDVTLTDSTIFDSGGDKIPDPDGETFDFDALKAANVLKNDGSYYISQKGTGSNIMIVDTGLDSATWNLLKNYYQQEHSISIAIDYIKVRVRDWQSEDPDVTYWRTSNPNSGIVNDYEIHGSMMTSVALQAAPKAHIYIVDMWTENWQYIDSGNFQENNNFAVCLRMAIDAISHYNLPIDTISIAQGLRYGSSTTGSFGVGGYWHFKERVDYYRNTKKIQFFTSTGNNIQEGGNGYEEYWWQLDFPGCYTTVTAIGTIYDDYDGEFSANEYSSINYRGEWVSYHNFPIGTNYPRWGSRYQFSGDNIRKVPDFSAMGFDVDVAFTENGQAGNYLSDGGTSQSTTFFAAMASQIYIELKQYEPATPNAVYDIIKRTCEPFSIALGKIPEPIPNSYNPNYWFHYLTVGYGLIDFYDAFNYVQDW